MKNDKFDREPLMASKQATSSEDPFYAVRDNVQTFVERIKIRYERFQDLIKNCDTATTPEFKELRKGLVKDIKSAERQIKDLRGAVDMVDRNREKFQHIKDSELNQRKRFVEDVNRIINDVKSYLESSVVRRKMDEDENRQKRQAVEMTANSDVERGNDQFIDDQRQVSKQLMKEQDVQVGALGQAVDRLGEMGRGINEELKLQNKMLDSLDNDLDDAGNKMNFVMGKLSKLLKTKDGCQIWTIVILGLILVALGQQSVHRPAVVSSGCPSPLHLHSHLFEFLEFCTRNRNRSRCSDTNKTNRLIINDVRLFLNGELLPHQDHYNIFFLK
eukprot:gene6501-13128_t